MNPSAEHFLPCKQPPAESGSTATLRHLKRPNPGGWWSLHGVISRVDPTESAGPAYHPYHPCAPLLTTITSSPFIPLSSALLGRKYQNPRSANIMWHSYHPCRLMPPTQKPSRLAHLGPTPSLDEGVPGMQMVIISSGRRLVSPFLFTSTRKQCLLVSLFLTVPGWTSHSRSFSFLCEKYLDSP